MKVALIEDNLALRGSLADFLGVNGHQVWEAGEAVEFYRLLGTEEFDVVVVDINLPDYDGFSITRYLSSKQRCAVILTSVRDTLEDRVKGYEAGADIYMAKPVEPEELSAIIAMIGRRSRPDPVVEAEVPPGKSAGWCLQLSGRQLWAPNGNPVGLTMRETRLLHAFAEQTSRVIKRDDLQEIIGGKDGTNRARLDTFVSRLRSKVRDKTGMELPLVTNRNAGFSFLKAIDLF